jgi:Ca-activated chloride channel family protein
MFRFGTPEYFYLLLSIPLLILLWVVYVRGRRKRLARFGKLATIGGLMPEASPKRVRGKFVLLLIAIGLIVTALARPQFGSRLRETTRRGVEILIAVDVSNSMLAEDFQPNRLERTKYAIDRLIEQLTEDRIGLIAFAGQAYVQLPVTSDYVTARHFVSRLSPDMISRQGTAIGAAIDLAAASFSAGSEGSRVLIVISDGENHEDDPVAAAKAAADQGIRIYTVGIGTAEGAPVSVDGRYLTDEAGELVVSQLDEQTLERIALAAGGGYIRASERSVGLTEIATSIGELEKQDLRTTLFEDYNEQYQYLLAAAGLLLILEALIISRKNRILARFDIFSRKIKN